MFNGNDNGCCMGIAGKLSATAAMAILEYAKIIGNCVAYLAT